MLSEASLGTNSMWSFLSKTLDPAVSVALAEGVAALREMQGAEVWGAVTEGKGCS